MWYLDLYLESVSGWLTDSEMRNITRIVLSVLFQGKQGMCVRSSRCYAMATIVTISALAHWPNYSLNNAIGRKNVTYKGNWKHFGYSKIAKSKSYDVQCFCWRVFTNCLFKTFPSIWWNGVKKSKEYLVMEYSL